jgi:hypothetical protein
MNQMGFCKNRKIDILGVKHYFGFGGFVARERCIAFFLFVHPLKVSTQIGYMADSIYYKIVVPVDASDCPALHLSYLGHIWT